MNRAGSWKKQHRRKRVIAAVAALIALIAVVALLVVDARIRRLEFADEVAGYRAATSRPRDELLENIRLVRAWIDDLDSESAALDLAEDARSRETEFASTAQALQRATADGPLSFARGTQVAAQNLLVEAAELVGVAGAADNPDTRQAVRRKAARATSIANSLNELAAWYLSGLATGATYESVSADVLRPNPDDPFELVLADEVQDDVSYTQEVEDLLDSLDVVLGDMRPSVTGVFALSGDAATLAEPAREWTSLFRKLQVRVADTPSPETLQAAHGALLNAMWLYIDSALSFSAAVGEGALADVFVANGKRLRDLADDLRVAATDEMTRVTDVPIGDPPESGFAPDPHDQADPG